MRIALALISGAVLTACAPTMTAAPAGAFQSATPLAVTLDNSWTHIPPQLNGVTNGSVLTRHGVALNRVDLISLESGQSLIRVGRDVDAPTFRAGMSELELVELATASLRRLGLTDIAPQNVRPHALAGAPGVRMSIVGKYESGLNLRGDIAMAESNGRLNVIMFLAPAVHYYDASATEIEHLIQSARIAE